MNHRRRVTLATVPIALIALLSAPAAMSLADTNPKPPAVKVTNRSFGDILQSKNKLPLYYWSVEKRAGGKIRCTGACARRVAAARRQVARGGAADDARREGEVRRDQARRRPAPGHFPRLALVRVPQRPAEHGALRQRRRLVRRPRLDGCDTAPEAHLDGENRSRRRR